MDSVLEVVSGLDFAIRGEALETKKITELLGIEPTRAFEKGELYKSRQRVGREQFRHVERRRPWGMWHFCTASYVPGGTMDDHAIFLLEKIEPAASAIRTLLTDPEYKVLLTIWYVGSGGFSMTARVVMRLAALCDDISITCWESNHLEEENEEDV